MPHVYAKNHINPVTNIDASVTCWHIKTHSIIHSLPYRALSSRIAVIFHTMYTEAFNLYIALSTNTFIKF